jgi:hypothetical protein
LPIFTTPETSPVIKDDKTTTTTTTTSQDTLSKALVLEKLAIYT